MYKTLVRMEVWKMHSISRCGGETRHYWSCALTEIDGVGVLDNACMHGETLEGKRVYDTHGRKHVHPVRVADVFLAYIVQ